MTTASLLRAALEAGVESHLPEGHGVLVLLGDDGKLKVQIVDRDYPNRLSSVRGDSGNDGNDAVWGFDPNDSESIRKFDEQTRAGWKVLDGGRVERLKGLCELLGIHEPMTLAALSAVNTLKPSEEVTVLCFLKALQVGGVR